jgi:hypothetical protein
MAKKHYMSEKKRLSRAVARRNLYRAYSLLLKSYKAEIWAPGVFWANFMHFILRILKYDILRVPPIQISTKQSTHSSAVWLCVAIKTKMKKTS